MDFQKTGDSGVNPRSSRARSCCKNRYLVTLTFAPLERNTWSQAQTHKNPMLFDSLLLRQDTCLSSSHLSCLNSRHLSCLNRRHLSCLNRRRDSCRPPATEDCQNALSFCVFELATPYSVREGRRSVSPTIECYVKFSLPSSAQSPPIPSIGLLKSRQNPSVQALFGELRLPIMLI